ncbi:hypothetical protein CTAYLR_009978 [Chrysophaeum taylorii]|uniref:glutathione gamma-glutamylcysteinyltransferase n=1 Tax=Chrysophaeum taylorii TaxID=2483200 RepID=A0AAD7XRK3_9STRA|nr:hypothetical protein CTAYLR_009978 [Chrysophaeum taylorii]
MGRGPVALASMLGSAYLEEAETSQYAVLAPHLRPQNGRSSCGLAATAVVFASFDKKPDREEDVLAAQQGTERLDSISYGITLDDLSLLMGSIGLECEAYRATDLATARRDLRRSLAADVRVVLNYTMRKVPGLGGNWGHHALVAAYHEPSDTFLVLDAATRLRPYAQPVWIDAPTLFAGMIEPDGMSGTPRGWLVCHRPTSACCLTPDLLPSL